MKSCLLIALGCAAVVGVLGALIYFHSKLACDARFDAPTRYGLIAGCQVKAQDGWVPERNYRAS